LRLIKCTFIFYLEAKPSYLKAKPTCQFATTQVHRETWLSGHSRCVYFVWLNMTQQHERKSMCVRGRESIGSNASISSEHTLHSAGGINYPHITYRASTTHT
jgi:hypothetical protein